ncbi:hypothetical protein [Sphingomonas nostoxanthinifaciens]|uniref:hypothetical protein n=1 Tax=Sphingomonas nostoxanthinifaciens TaxID=2872652 RepID=UPI001CC2021D|nr:hypothetical protein [Sphingomonas nostoxanthinifaciens]UAK25034.1 hypothetical protein K8P63_02135 [Sphingomonas nostoxanthinifaciens]
MKAGRALVAVAMALSAVPARSAVSASPHVTVTIPASVGQPVDGRLILLLSPKLTGEPREQVSLESALKSPFMFGQTIDGVRAGASVSIGSAAFGWPVANLRALPAGDYMMQVVLNRYETFHRADGPVVKLAPDKGEGQNWKIKPGNLYSRPVRVHWDPKRPPALAATLDQVMPPIADKPDTDYIKHVRIKSARLSAFWGRPVYLRAHVLLPDGFAAHPQAHYPLMVFHGHFPDDISGFRTTPPDPNLKPDYSERFHVAGYNRIQQQEAYAFYQKWIAKDFPRFIVIEIDHANPFFDDSYAINSANLGPYGDAINYELIPEIEKRPRGIGQGWARFTYGGSTGGWEAIATQVFYPDMYNGAFVACPSPLDYHTLTVIDLYGDKNAYVLKGNAQSIERPAMRTYLGEIIATQRDINYQELVAGDKGRSGGLYDGWQAVWSPMGKDGYPDPVFDKVTGAIKPEIAAYWREHSDLTHIIQRDWKTLGPKLAGKLHIYVGIGDNYFLTDAVYRMQDVLEGLSSPAYGGEVAYGNRAEHCWNGDPTQINALTRLHYNFQFLPKIVKRIADTAPPGADLTSWRY